MDFNVKVGDNILFLQLHRLFSGAPAPSPKDEKRESYDDVMCTPKFGLINNSDSMSSVLYRAHVV